MLCKIIIKIILNTKLTNFVYNPLYIIVSDKYIEILLRNISIYLRKINILYLNYIKGNLNDNYYLIPKSGFSVKVFFTNFSKTKTSFIHL